MKFKKIVVGIGETNGYIVYDEEKLEAVIIDPGDESKSFIKFIDKSGLTPTSIVLTHYHYDHIGAVEDIRDAYGCPVSIHKKDVEGLKNSNLNHSLMGFRRSVEITPDRILLDGDSIEAGDIVLRVIHTPGHTLGAICLMNESEKIVFTGDTIFKDDIGRMDLEGGSEESMRRTILNKVNKWSNDIILYPGHGEEASMEYIRKKNGEFQYMLR